MSRVNPTFFSASFTGKMFLGGVFPSGFSDIASPLKVFFEVFGIEVLRFRQGKKKRTPEKGPLNGSVPRQDDRVS